MEEIKLNDDLDEGSSDYSRSCTPESMASTDVGMLATDFYSDDEKELDLDGGLEQTIAVDLEKLTDTGSSVNKLELTQQHTWREYMQVKEAARQRLAFLKKKLLASIEKTEPFVQLWRKAKDLQEEAHRAALQFERAHSEYESAKETLRIAETGLEELEQQRKKDSRNIREKSPAFQIDQAWQETLSNATLRVEKANKERIESQIQHHRLTVEFEQCQQQCHTMEQTLKRQIKKSRPFYEERYKFNQKLVDIKKRIQHYDECLSNQKTVYKKTMQHLESLSSLLHEERDRRRSNSVLATSSEPFLEQRSATPDFPLNVNVPQRKAITPDSRRKDKRIGNVRINFFGSSGSLPTVEKSSVSPDVVFSPKSDVRIVVESCLSKALDVYEKEKETCTGNHIKDENESIIISNDVTIEVSDNTEDIVLKREKENAKESDDVKGEEELSNEKVTVEDEHSKHEVREEEKMADREDMLEKGDDKDGSLEDDRIEEIIVKQEVDQKDKMEDEEEKDIGNIENEKIEDVIAKQEVDHKDMLKMEEEKLGEEKNERYVEEIVEQQVHSEDVTAKENGETVEEKTEADLEYLKVEDVRSETEQESGVQECLKERDNDIEELNTNIVLTNSTDQNGHTIAGVKLKHGVVIPERGQQLVNHVITPNLSKLPLQHESISLLPSNHST